MSAKKEKLIKITKDRDGSEVIVYKEYDQENPYFSEGLRFVHKENDNAEEVEMQPFEISIEELKEKQHMGLLHPLKINQLETLISFKPNASAFAFVPN